MDNNITNLDPITAILLGINSTDPEIVGSDSLELNLEFPIGESTPIKLNLKFSSVLASSVVAQKALHDMAHEDVDFIGSKIAEAINYVFNNLSDWTDKALDASIQPMKHRKWNAEYYKLEEA